MIGSKNFAADKTSLLIVRLLLTIIPPLIAHDAAGKLYIVLVSIDDRTPLFILKLLPTLIPPNIVDDAIGKLYGLGIPASCVYI